MNKVGKNVRLGAEKKMSDSSFQLSEPLTLHQDIKFWSAQAIACTRFFTDSFLNI